MKNVLVFPCGTEIGLEINKSLKNSKFFKIFGASSEKINHGLYAFDNYIGELPYVTDDNFMDNLNELIIKYKIDYIYPAHDSVLLELTRIRDEIKCEIIASEYMTCKICRDKLETYKIFENEIDVPKIYNLEDKIDTYPVFLKPNIGQGSQDTYLVHNKDELDFHVNRNSKLMILEYLPGNEYTVDCFTDRKGELKYIYPRERRRVRNGISVNTYPVEDIEFNNIAKKINKILNLRGAWFFQVKRNKNNKLVLLEIEPRIAGSMGINRCIGVNLPLITLFDFKNIDIDIINNNFNICLDRALENKYKIDIEYDELFIDLDDTIIIRQAINVNLIKFLFQCVNEKKRITLITRHLESDLEDYLKKYRIYEIFDEIIAINDGSEKYKYIKNLSSIFIDDSYAERKDVKDNIGIPVFDIDSIECLIK